MGGPLLWKVDETIADAAAVRPWIAVPAGGIRSLGYLECSARGILLIENSEPFEQVCRQGGITDRWLHNLERALSQLVSAVGMEVEFWRQGQSFIRLPINSPRRVARRFR
ncbi:hypothetical protein AB0L70_40640 [Kribbella sp. NPDC051952]|uniref:hypothetical protein n=1 Tax=Kribbella sp. NPDC051952 TaxID=3154851 RepID=UPI003423C47C